MKIQQKEQFDSYNVFGLGSPNDAYAQYFIGQSYLNPLTEPKDSSVFLANVTFEPGCRNHWHIHRAKSGGGQLLICIAGEGWYQEYGKQAVSLCPGMVISIPANVKHWHGAEADCLVQPHRCGSSRGANGKTNGWSLSQTSIILA